jgi:hypothetical protein
MKPTRTPFAMGLRGATVLACIVAIPIDLVQGPNSVWGGAKKGQCSPNF